MNNSITLKELQEKADAYALDCSDAYTNETLRFSIHGDMIYKTKESNYDVSMTGKPNDHAYSQIIGRLDAPPASWLLSDKRCSPELRAKILNNLAVTRQKDDLFNRHKGETIRAFLSDEYTPFDNPKMVELIATACETLGYEVKVLRPQVGDYLSAYIMLPQITFDRDPRHNTDGNGGLHPPR